MRVARNELEFLGKHMDVPTQPPNTHPSMHVLENVELALVPLVSIQASSDPTRFPISLRSWQNSSPKALFQSNLGTTTKTISKSLTALEFGLSRDMLEITRAPAGPGHLSTCTLLQRSALQAPTCPHARPAQGSPALGTPNSTWEHLLP